MQYPDDRTDADVDYRDELHRFLNFQYIHATPDEVRISWDVPEWARQLQGIVHGGAYCGVVEAAASRGAAAWWGDRGTVVGVSNQTNFLRPFRAGLLTVIASPIQRGRTAQVWEVRITDDKDRLVALGQVRLQNLPGNRDSNPQANL
jgi:uncharacterized protein (TIGR00369 family)